MSVWAVIAAAGSGERLGLDRPKAFANLRDRPLLAESLERLEESDWIDSIVVAAPPDWEEPVILLAERREQPPSPPPSVWCLRTRQSYSSTTRHGRSCPKE